MLRGEREHFQRRLLGQEPAAWRHSWHFGGSPAADQDQEHAAGGGTPGPGSGGGGGGSGALCCRRSPSLNGSHAALHKHLLQSNGVFPWRRATAGGASPCSSSSPSQSRAHSRAHSPAPPPSPSPAHAAPSSTAAAAALRPATPDAARTAPATPIKEANNSTEGQYRRSPGLSKSVRHTKNGTIGHVDEPPTSRSDWDIHRACCTHMNVSKKRMCLVYYPP